MREGRGSGRGWREVRDIGGEWDEKTSREISLKSIGEGKTGEGSFDRGHKEVNRTGVV